MPAARVQRRRRTRASASPGSLRASASSSRCASEGSTWPKISSTCGVLSRQPTRACISSMPRLIA
eukprot:738441-Pyramimonas_sp.AAC.1